MSQHHHQQHQQTPEVHVHVHHDGLARVERLLGRIEEKLDTILQQGTTIMATQKQITEALNLANDRLKKVGTETAGLLEKIEDLKAQVDAAGTSVSPELQAAVDAVIMQAGVLDDLVPDQPIVPQPGP